MTTNRKAHPKVEDLIVHRWSPRSFDASEMPLEDLEIMFEAAGWAPSAYNVQPWTFLYARRGDENWDRFLAQLIDFNQSWAKDASALVFVVSDKLMRSEKGNSDNHSHSFDAGSAWAMLFTSLVRWILHAGIGGYIRTGGDSSRIWLIGDAEGIKRSEDALKRIRPNAQLAGSSSWPSGPLEAARMSELISTLRLDEIIFDAESMATGDIIDRMLQLQGSGVELRILPPKANFIVGSQRVFQAGDGSGLEGHVLSTPLNQRNKRATDHLIGWLAILLAPVLCFSHLGRHILKNIAKVWIGEKTWVGFKSEPTPSGGSKREAVIHCTDLLSEQPPEAELTRQIDLLYARDYRWRNDLNILWRSLFHSKV